MSNRDWLKDMKAAGHDPVLDEDGSLDTFALSEGFHNGPRCKTCKWGVCHHCHGDEPIPPCPKPIEVGSL